MKINNSEKFTLLCLIGGLIFSFLFFKSNLGINVPLFLLCSLTIFIISCKYNKVMEWNYAWLICIPILLLSVRFVLSSNPGLNFLNVLVILFLFTTMGTLIYTENKPYDKFSSLFFCILGAFIAPFKFIAKPFSALKNHKMIENSNKQSIKYIIFGLIGTIPLVVVVLTLLMSADSVFKTTINKILNKTSFAVVWDIVLFLLIATIVYIIMYTFIHKFKEPKKETVDIPKTIDSSIPVEIYIIPLIALTLVYGLFIFIQFAYLFGHPLSLPADLTYSQYARNGFFELVIVSVINFVFILLGIILNKKGQKLLDIAVETMQSLVIFFTGIMLYSAYFRMNIYEGFYGSTMLRLLVYFFLAFEVIALIYLILKTINKDFKFFKFTVITAIIFFTLFNYINPDAYIAKNNIDRYFETGTIDEEYLLRLSYDALPQIKRLIVLENELGESIRNTIENKYNLDNLDTDKWQEFNLSRKYANDIYENELK